MVGLIGGGLASSATLDAAGLDAIPAPSGDVAAASVGEGFAGSPGPRLFRLGNTLAGRSDLASEDSFGQVAEPPPMLEPAEAQDRFGLPGLNFDRPISLPAAQALYDEKRAQAVRQDTINRRAPSLLTGGAAQLVYGFVGGMLDPVNLAAALVPGVGEARVAGMLGEGLAARIGARAIAGASAGAAGQAALEPLTYALDKAEGNDWTMAQALRNIAFGAALGGGLHVVGGAIGDLAGRREAGVADAVAEPPARSNPVTTRLDALDPAARESVLRGAVAQHAEGAPVRVADAVEVSELARYADVARTDPALSEWMQVRDDAEFRLSDRRAEADAFNAAREARNRGEAPALLADYQTPAAVDAAIRGRELGISALQGRLAIAERAVAALREGSDPGFRLRYDDPALNRPAGVDAPGNMPQTLLSRIRELGGLQDSGGELAARDLDKTPGMVRPGGMRLERAAVRMAEEGYLPELARDMAGNGPAQADTIGALLDAIDEQRSGRPRLREQDIPVWDELNATHEAALGNLRGAAERLGITEAEARGLSRGQVQDLLRRPVEPAAGSEAVDLPGWDELPKPRTLPELSRDMGTAVDRLRSAPEDAVGMADERLMRETTARAPQVEASEPMRQLGEAQAAADAVLARLQVEVQAGRLPADAVAKLDEAVKMAEGEARAHEAAAACFATRGL